MDFEAMQLHHLRNATTIISAAGQRILVDPMLGAPHSLPPYAFVRFRPRHNPTVPLPANATATLADTTACLVTHCHGDHLDRAGIAWLQARRLPVYCSVHDAPRLRAWGLDVHPLTPETARPFFGGEITPIIAPHGTGLVGRLLGPGIGYLIRLPGEPSLYLSGDTVSTRRVRQVLRDDRPDVVVIAAGGARLDVGQPILMPLADVIACAKLAPRLVIANHLEALNHCPTTRAQLRAAVVEAGLASRVRAPEDGEVVIIDGV